MAKTSLESEPKNEELQSREEFIHGIDIWHLACRVSMKIEAHKRALNILKITRAKKADPADIQEAEDYLSEVTKELGELIKKKGNLSVKDTLIFDKEYNQLIRAMEAREKAEAEKSMILQQNSEESIGGAFNSSEDVLSGTETETSVLGKESDI